ncbi:MAG: cupin domain-containing protein [Rhizobiaceae bacterium]
MSKSPPRLIERSSLSFRPRFEYGDQAQVASICGPDDGTKLGAGFVRMTDAQIPWTIRYDEIIHVLEGSFGVRAGDEELRAEAGDCIWLPAGTELTYVSQSALLFYAIQPADWADAP